MLINRLSYAFYLFSVLASISVFGYDRCGDDRCVHEITGMTAADTKSKSNLLDFTTSQKNCLFVAIGECLRRAIIL